MAAPRALRNRMEFSYHHSRGGPGPAAARALLRLQARAGVQADDLGVHVAVREHLDGEGGELRGEAETLREQHIALELFLERLGAGALAVDGSVDEPGGYREDPGAHRGQVTGDGQGHADDAALRRRIRGLADLAIERGDRRGVHDRAPLA